MFRGRRRAGPALARGVPRLGGSDAQRELVEEARISALLRAGRYDDARDVLDERLDRRHSPRDQRWRAACQRPAAEPRQARVIRPPATVIRIGSSPVGAGPATTSPVAESYWLPW